MSHIMTATEFIDRLKFAMQKKTLYIYGCFGAPMNDKNKERYTTNRLYNQKAVRKAKISACTPDVFGFDCVCLVKGILWGWNGDEEKTYGGAVYQSNGVPDTTITNLLKNFCTDVSEDFTTIVPGEFLVMPDHCGVYIGDGYAIESTPKWDDGVQVSEVWNISKITDKGRNWISHGKLKFIDYTTEKHIISSEIPTSFCEKDINEIVSVLKGMGLNPKLYREVKQ